MGAVNVPTRSRVGSVDWRAVAFNVSTSLPEGSMSENSGTDEVDLSCLAPRLRSCCKGFSLDSSIFVRFFFLYNTLHLSQFTPIKILKKVFEKLELGNMKAFRHSLLDICR